MRDKMESTENREKRIRCWSWTIFVIVCWTLGEISFADSKANAAKSDKQGSKSSVGKSEKEDKGNKGEKKGDKKDQKGEKKSVTLDFEDELVTGDAAQPEVMAIMERQEFNFKRLIRLRKDFLNEMRKTSEDLERGSR